MKIAIQGHPTRGKEVIQIFKDLGTEGLTDHTGSFIDRVYLRDDSLRSNQLIVSTDIEFLKRHGYNVYTLEKFEKEFPFKVGDEVFTTINKRGTHTFKGYVRNIDFDKHVYICSFEDSENASLGGLDSRVYCKPEELFIMKKERNITLTLDKAKEWYKKGGELKEIALQAFTEQELNPLPRSWAEFCEKYPIQDHEAFINYANGIITTCKECAGSGLGIWIRKPEKDRCKCVSQKSAEAHLAMIQLEQLRDCWKQGWEPDWNNGNQMKYCVFYYQGKFKISILNETRYFLSFPTKEMAEEFLECFRDLIERAGDLI